MIVKSKSLADTDNLAKMFAKNIAGTGAFVCLYGEIGSGKTTFIKSLAKHLGVKENVTSPSFVILNEYHSGALPIYHFDLYRLEDEGIKTIADELSEYSEGKILTLIEWAQFATVELPKNRIEITIKYIDDTTRMFEFKAEGENNTKMLKETDSAYSHP